MDDAGRGTETTRRVLVLGANGPTGRETVQQAVDRGYRVHALTRHPEDFPVTHDRVRVVAGDATDPAVVDAAVAGTDAVVCTIGARFTRSPVEVYSTTAHLVITSMVRHGRRRLVVVTSSGVAPSHLRRGLVQRASYRLVRSTFARTVYDDMARMETFVRGSGLDWTIVRPPGLTNGPRGGWTVAEDEIEGSFCTRADLAEMLLDQLEDDRFVHRVAALATPGLSVGARETFRTEILKR